MSAVEEANDQLLDKQDTKTNFDINQNSEDPSLEAKEVQDQRDKIKIKKSKSQNSDVMQSYQSVVSQKHYVQYGQRWLILIFFLLTSLINGIPYETCVPIATEIHNIYGVSDFWVTSAASLYMVMHPVLTFWASGIIVNKGWGYATNLGAILTILGCALRLLINQLSFYIILPGQLLCGIGRPLILNGQASMAQNWFFPKARTYILTLQSIVHSFSIVFGLLIPGSIVFKGYEFDSENKQKSIDEGRKLTFWLMFFEFLLTILLVPALFIIKTSAPTPPSALANSDQPIAVKQAMKQLFVNKNFLVVFIPYSIYFGFLKAYSVILPYIVHAFNFNANNAAVAGSFPMIGGFVSQIVVSILISNFKRYKLTAIVLVLLTISCLPINYLIMELHKPILLYMITFFLGFFLYPLIPLMLELSCEIVYPLSGSFAVGLLYSGATILAVVNAQLFTIILNGSNSTKGDVVNGLSIIGLAMLLGLVIFMFVKEKFNRTEEIKARLHKSSVYFKKSSIHKSFQSKLNHQDHQSLNTSSITGEYPTYYPQGDRLQFVQHPEVFDPDFIEDAIMEEEEEQEENKNILTNNDEKHNKI